MGYPVIPTAGHVTRIAALNALIYNDTENPAMIRLYKNDVSPDANMTLATFVEADVAGYAALAAAFGLPTMNDQGLIVSRSALFNLIVAAGVDPQTIYGVYITDTDETKVLFAQRFEVPQTVGGPLPTSISGVFRYSDPLSSYGWIDVES